MIIYKEKFYDANFTHFTELLTRYEEFDVSVSSMQTILEEQYIFSPIIT